MMEAEDKKQPLWLQPRDVVVSAVRYLNLISATEFESGVSLPIGKMTETLQEAE